MNHRKAIHPPPLKREKEISIRNLRKNIKMDRFIRKILFLIGRNEQLIVALPPIISLIISGNKGGKFFQNSITFLILPFNSERVITDLIRRKEKFRVPLRIGDGAHIRKILFFFPVRQIFYFSLLKRYPVLSVNFGGERNIGNRSAS